MGLRALEIETVVFPGGTVTFDDVPFAPGTRARVIVLAPASASIRSHGSQDPEQRFRSKFDALLVKSPMSSLTPTTVCRKL